MPRAKGGSIPPPREVVEPGFGGIISVLNHNDVLAGRGGRINNHPGNITFRRIVEDYKLEYLDPRTRKLAKAHVAARLVSQIRNSNPPGRFLKEVADSPGCFVEIGDKKAWKKAGQALREDAPEVRKEIDEEPDIESFTPQPIYSHPGMHMGLPPAISYPPNYLHHHHLPPEGSRNRPDPPEAEGVTGFRQPPLSYLEPGHVSGVGPSQCPGRGTSPGYPTQPQYPPFHMSNVGPSGQQTLNGHAMNYYGPPNSQQYPPQSHPHQPNHQSQYQYQSSTYSQPVDGHNYHRDMPPPPQRQPQFMRGRHQYPPWTPERLGDFPSLKLSTGTDFTMSDVSEFTPVADQKRNSTKEKGDTLVQSSKRKSILAMSELSMSGLKSSGLNADKGPGLTADPDVPMSLALSRNFSFPDLLLNTGESTSEPLTTGQADGIEIAGGKRNSAVHGAATQKINDGKRLLRHPNSNSSGSSSTFSCDSFKVAKFHQVRARTNTDVSGINDGMSLMSIEHQSVRSELSWLEALKSMQSITSEMNPWTFNDGSGLRHVNGADDGSVRSFLSDMSNELNALDLAESPLLPPIRHTDSGFEDSLGFMHRQDP